MRAFTIDRAIGFAPPISVEKSGKQSVESGLSEKAKKFQSAFVKDLDEPPIGGTDEGKEEFIESLPKEETGLGFSNPALTRDGFRDELTKEAEVVLFNLEKEIKAKGFFDIQFNNKDGEPVTYFPKDRHEFLQAWEDYIEAALKETRGIDVRVSMDDPALKDFKSKLEAWWTKQYGED